jgi:hypothetical protein
MFVKTQLRGLKLANGSSRSKASRSQHHANEGLIERRPELMESVFIFAMFPVIEYIALKAALAQNNGEFARQRRHSLVVYEHAVALKGTGSAPIILINAGRTRPNSSCELWRKRLILPPRFVAGYNYAIDRR